ncbi:MAG TPA: long-chain fatty acid--CoA ligase [Mariprofundaceae bacterium]|nr:long-chain fatty acid--CoA ligase [Mariprofundaceae bacterium]
MNVDTSGIQRVSSLPEALFANGDHGSSRPAQWYRREDGYVPVTYAQLISRVRHIASGLIRAGIQPGDRIGLLMENRPEWAAIDYAILSIGAVTVPLYCNYRPQDIAYVLKDCGAVAIFTSGGQLLRHLLQASRECPELHRIYCLEQATGSGSTELLTSLEAGEIETTAIEQRLASLTRQTLATLVYTSGTTANPKGVMLTHGNILTNLEAVPDVLQLRTDDRMLSFLPLAHALERMGGHFLVYSFGISVAFAERPDTVAKNLVEAEPTILISVPRMLEVVRSRMLAQVAKQPAIQRQPFNRYLRLSERRRHAKLNLFDNLIFRLLDGLVGGKVRARFGGHLRLLVSGGAPLSIEVGEFFENLGLPVIEGYGLTESAPLLTVNPLHDRRPGSVGKAAGVELRIAEDGEILARGNNIMPGYWKLPEATAEALDADGWLHTGDIGELDADDYLRITDRKKDLIVNSGGENIAPQRIEAMLVGDPMIDQAVIFGDKRPYLIALIVPNRESCAVWAKESGLPDTDWEHLCRAEIFRKQIQSRINGILKPLNPFEQIRRILIVDQPMTIEDGLLTPTLKVKRRKVYEKFAAQLEQLYAGS